MPITRVKGFNLLELIFTLVILGFIISAALPSYKHHLQAARRLDAKTALVNLAAHLERYYLLHHSYEQATFANLGLSEQSPGGFYQLQILAVGPVNYSLAAVPQGAQRADRLCASFSLDHLGRQGISGNSTVAECWQ